MADEFGPIHRGKKDFNKSKKSREGDPPLVPAIMQFRGSSFGSTEEEIYRYAFKKGTRFATLGSNRGGGGFGGGGGGRGQELEAKAGTALHALIEAQQYAAGNITAAEEFVWDPESRTMGYLDVQSKLGIGDYKTVTREKMAEVMRTGKAFEEHISQVNLYLHATGQSKGYIQYILRDDPSVKKFIEVRYDDERYKADLAKLNRVRERIADELRSGKITPDMLQMTPHWEWQREQTKGAFEELKESAKHIDELTDVYLKAQQKVEFAKLYANRPLNPVKPRPDYNTIAALPHGWFGDQRRENTPFGSGIRIKAFDLSEEFLAKYLNNQAYVDIETTGLDFGKSKLLQIGLKTPEGGLQEINVMTGKNTVMPELHTRKGGLVDWWKNHGVDLTRRRGWSEVRDPTGTYSFKSSVMAKNEAIEYLRNRISNRPLNIIGHNLRFESKTFGALSNQVNPVQFSTEYESLVALNRQARIADLRSVRAGALTPVKARAAEAARQLDVYHLMMSQAKKGGAIIDTMEIAKTVNALAQQKGLVNVTGDIVTGSSVEFLARHLLGKEELHVGVADILLQEELAEKLTRLVEKLKKSGFTESQLTKEEATFFRQLSSNQLRLKVNATRKQIQRAISEISEGNKFKFFGGMRSTSDINEVLKYLSEAEDTTIFATQGARVVDYGVHPSKIVKEALSSGLGESEKAFLRQRGAVVEEVRAAEAAAVQSRLGLKNIKNFLASPKGMILAGTVTAAGLIAIGANSGSDDNYNSIQGLRHGWFGKSRKYFTDFGSGYRAPIYEDDPKQGIGWGGLAVGGAAAFGGYKALGVTTGINIDDLSYLGGLTEGRKWSKILGRQKATIGDVLYAGVRRAEYSFGGILRTFSLSTMMSSSFLKDAEVAFDLTRTENASVARYFDELTKRKLVNEGVSSVHYKQGKLVTNTGETLLEEARLYQGLFDANPLELNKIHGPKSKFVKSYETILGTRGIGRSSQFFVGGGNTRFEAAKNTAHAFAHESFSKYLGLMDDPARALGELPFLPKIVSRAIGKVSRFIPKLGVGGWEKMAGKTLPQLVGMHARTVLPWVIAAPFVYKTASWLVQQGAQALGLGDTPVGKAGITGLLAETGRMAHMTAARISQYSGLTSWRRHWEKQAPGMIGVLPTLGIALTGAMTGGAIAAAMDVAQEGAMAGKGAYQQMIRSLNEAKQLPGFLSKIPGFKGEYTRVGRGTRIGLLAGLAVATPLLIAGLGMAKTPDELNEEYLGKKEVAIRKGRFWELGCLPKGEVVLNQDFIPVKVEDIKIGDCLQTARNSNAVDRVMERTYTGDIYKISCHHSDKVLRLTPNHPVLTTQKGYIRADELTLDDELIIPKKRFTPEIDEIKVTYQHKDKSIEFAIDMNEDIGWLLGQFFISGTIIERNKENIGVKILFKRENNEDLKKATAIILSLLPQSEFRSESFESLRAFEITSPMLAHIFDLFVLVKGTKTINQSFWSFPEPFLKGFISGIISGNLKPGSLGPLIFDSPAAMYQIRSLFLSFGIFLDVMKKPYDPIGGSLIFGEKAARKTLSTFDVLSKGDFVCLLPEEIHYREEEDYFAIRISDIKTADYSGIVYDFSVPPVKNFLTPIGIVHNSTPYEGGKIQRYEPNWYNKLIDQPADKVLFKGEEVGPLTELWRDISDPYWKEKLNWKERPYPIAGPSGEGMGIFGPLYESTLGRVLKPPALMHTEDMMGTTLEGMQNPNFAPLTPGAPGTQFDPAEKAMTEFKQINEQGKLDSQQVAYSMANSPYTAEHQLAQAWHRSTQALGLRGFAARSIKQFITGEDQFSEYSDFFQSSADMNSVRRSYWDMEIGGALLLSESYRRLNPNRPYSQEYENPIRNRFANTATFLPGTSYFIDFKTGDPYSKIASGEYRLPGAGLEERYPELKGLKPDEYPLIYKYKILADVAPFSRQFENARKKLEENPPTDRELAMFLETEAQLVERRKYKNFTEDEQYSGILGAYAQGVKSVIRNSPLEQNPFFAPGHKFLALGTPEEEYERSIYGKDFRSWTDLYGSMIRPMASMTLNAVMDLGIPAERQEARDIEDYFDKLEYIKYKRLSIFAESVENESFKKYMDYMAGRTLTGADPYEKKTPWGAIPLEERGYLEAILNSKNVDRTRVLELAPENTRDFLIAEWDKRALNAIESGEIQASSSEKEAITEQIKSRADQMRSIREKKAAEVMADTPVPPPDWIGWDLRTKMDDIKLKYLIDEGRDYHYHNLWDNRLKEIRKVPGLGYAVEVLQDAIGKSQRRLSKSDVEAIARKTGLAHPHIIVQQSSGIQINLDYERDEDIRAKLAELEELQ